jgi:hypothetical protein
MWLKFWIIAVVVIGSLVIAEEEGKIAEETGSDVEATGEENQDESEATTDRVETFSADINFNSWSELYDYLKEIEEATSENTDADAVESAVRLQLMTDGDALTLDGENNEEGEPVIVHGTISDVIHEVPAPDLSQSKVLIGDEEDAQKSDKSKIITTKADWTFIQHTLKTLDEKETAVKPNPEDEAIDEELTEEERKGKDIFEKGKQITTLTRANRKLAHNMFMEAAELGYIPAKERVAWSQLLGSNSLEELPIAKTIFEELANLGKPDSQTVYIHVLHCFSSCQFLINFILL